MKRFWALHISATALVFLAGTLICLRNPESAFQIVAIFIIPFGTFIMSYAASRISLHLVRRAALPFRSVLAGPIAGSVMTAAYLLAMFLLVLGMFQAAYMNIFDGIAVRSVLLMSFSFIPAQGIILMLEYMKAGKSR